MIFRHFFALCLLWSTALSLQGCGGGNSTSGGIVQQPIVAAGVYSGTVNQRNYVGVLAADNSFFGLLEATTDDLYSGQVTGIGTTRAEAATLTFFRNTSATLVSVNANFTPPADGTVNVRMSQPDRSSDLNFATQKATLVAGSLSNVARTWSGKLSYGLGSNPNFSVSINSAGDIAAQGGFSYSTACQFIGGSKLTPTNTTANVFNLTLVIADVTSCTLFSNQTLTGVAFLLSNPEPGVSQRMIWMATAANGIGISFKADR